MRVLSLAGGNAGKIINMPFDVAQKVIRSGLGMALDDIDKPKAETEKPAEAQDRPAKQKRRPRARARSRKGR